MVQVSRNARTRPQGIKRSRDANAEQEKRLGILNREAHLDTLYQTVIRTNRSVSDDPWSQRRVWQDRGVSSHFVAANKGRSSGPFKERASGPDFCRCAFRRPADRAKVRLAQNGISSRPYQYGILAPTLRFKSRIPVAETVRLLILQAIVSLWEKDRRQAQQGGVCRTKLRP